MNGLSGLSTAASAAQTRAERRERRTGEGVRKRTRAERARRNDNPQSGYDDTLWVVLETHYGDGRGSTTVVAAYADEDAARAAADERTGAFVSTRVECCGLHR